MKEKLISKGDFQKISPFFSSFWGNIAIKLVMKITGLNKVNKVYDNSKMYEGVQFCKHMLDDLDIKIVCENKDVLNQFKDGSFITVSNHAYGHIDGITAIDIVGSVRKDYKMMVNYVLAMIDTMSMHFIAVNPYSTGKLSSKSSLEGIKECLAHIRDGHPLGFFPAGAVSKTRVEGFNLRVKDREWQPSVIKIIKASKVPVIPMYFTGQNSWFFNFLDLINWRLRSIRLGHEVTNKRGKTIYVRFGEPIMPDEISSYKNIVDLGNFLKDKTYELARDTDLKK